MSRPKWTLMLIPHGEQEVKSVQLSTTGVRAVLSLLLLVALLLGTFTISLVTRQSQHLRAQQLERENLLLATEVEQMRQTVDQLNESLDAISDRSEKFRAVAGLSAIDPEVQRVGIGGPGTPALESSDLYRTNPELGEQVFAASYDLTTLQRRANLLRSSIEEAITSLSAHTERLEATPSILPSSGHLSSLFSRNRLHPVLQITRPHEGIDISAPIGEPILAPAKGVVRIAGMQPGGYGNTVEIDHGYGYLTRFAHASRILVRNGQRVERGQVIAEVGATGLVSGPHLHYEVEVNGKPVDPLNFIISDAVPD
ncbi:MAG TPA: M23 family metallopeptidase [Longimicrobiaceae bacterium]|nr:M23 family metallopeptidase [Longimicrobiaceae bacterium]